MVIFVILHYKQLQTQPDNKKRDTNIEGRRSLCRYLCPLHCLLEPALHSIIPSAHSRLKPGLLLCSCHISNISSSLAFCVSWNFSLFIVPHLLKDVLIPKIQDAQV